MPTVAPPGTFGIHYPLAAPMHSRLTELVADLAVHRASVLRAAESLPHAQWKRRPEAERWSVVEVYEHLARVEMGIGRLLAKRAADARVTGHPSETETASMLTSLDNFPVIDRSRRFPAPEQLLPPPDLEVASVLDHLATSRASLLRAIESADGLALGSIEYSHPAFGPLHMYQWLVFVGQHEARHALQIAEIVAVVA